VVEDETVCGNNGMPVGGVGIGVKKDVDIPEELVEVSKTDMKSLSELLTVFELEPIELGGGFSGGGRGTVAGALIIVLRASKPESIRISASNVGTSERNSRSSAERDNDSCEDEFLDLENRPRNLETTVGATGSFSEMGGERGDGETVGLFDIESFDSLNSIEETCADVIFLACDRIGLGADVVWMSELPRGEAVIFREDKVGAGEEARFGLESAEEFVAFRPKKENKPPVGFFLFSSGVSSLVLSTIFHPEGVTSSGIEDGLAFTEASQEVSPFDDT